MPLLTTTSQSKRRRLVALLALSVVAGGLTGCNSMGARLASLNPFSNSDSALGDGASPGTIPESAKMAGWTSGKEKIVAADETDPTSLAHKAEVTAEVFCANGRLWESTGNFEKAMQSYAKALEKEPNDPEALANIARLHLRQGNHKQAAEYFGNAIKQKPDDPGLYNDLGLALSKLGNHSAAATTIEQALRLSPGSSRFTNNLACVRFDGGDPEGAMQVFVQNNKPAVAHFNMAYLHFSHGQKSESTRHLNQAIAYEAAAASDPATKRAVERSRELLAQIDGRAPASKTLPAATAPAGVMQPGTAIAGNAAASTQASTTFTVSDKAPATNVGNATYRTSPTIPATQSPAVHLQGNPTSGAQAVSGQAVGGQTSSVPAYPAAGTAGPRAATGNAAPKSTFELPPGFQLP
ncbi:MAG: tetratricopeptide repeat protein [Planctomycetota bacterium]